MKRVKMMTTFRRKNISAVLLSALITSGLAVGLSSLSAWAGDLANLNRVDFTTENGTTDIRLVADGPIKYKRVKASNNKLVLEISGVDQNHTVNTNFVDADNISHVVIQPMRNERIRLIVRGDELARPTISVNKIVDATKVASKKNSTQEITRQIAERTEAAIDAMAEENMHPATLAVSDVSPVEPSDVSTALNGNTIAKAKNIESSATDTNIEEASNTIPETSIDDAELLDDRFFIDDAQTGERVSNNDGEPMALAHLDEQTGLATTDSIARSETFVDKAGRWLNQPSVTDSLAFGLLGLLIIGLVGFIRHKVQRISMNANAAEEQYYQDEHQQQRQGGGFRQAARNAMMNQGNQEQSASFEQMMAHNARQQQGGSPIGLRSLSGEPQQTRQQRQQPRQNPQQAQAPQRRSPVASRPASPSLNQRPAAKPNTKTVSQRQVASQYARQNNALAAKPTTKKQPSGKPSAKPGASRVGHPSIKPEVNRKRTIGDTALRSEMDRQEQIRREAIQRANLREDITRRPQAAGKAPQAPFRKPASRRATAPNARLNQGMFANQAGNASDPLPDNPEVLNFLRDVADLMDKEGQPNVVRKVQNNLS